MTTFFVVGVCQYRIAYDIIVAWEAFKAGCVQLTSTDLLLRTLTDGLPLRTDGFSDQKKGAFVDKLPNVYLNPFIYSIKSKYLYNLCLWMFISSFGQEIAE